jgi:predicted porin
MKGRAIRFAAASAAVCLLMGATPALAQSANADLLLKLKEKGILSDEEYNQLMERDKATAVTTAAAQPAPQAAAAALDDKRAVRMSDSGVGFEMGGVTLKFSGSVNGFYVHDTGDKSATNTNVVGGLATVGNNSSSVRNGLLPGFLKVDVTTNQAGWDIGAHFGLYPGINSVTGVGGANSAGSPTALSTSGIDFRQTYVTFGRKGLGEFKIGRDIGLFASEAILNDITLLSSGTPAGNAAPSNTTLGRIGIGYIYTDFQPQVTYTTPNLGGFQASVGVFQPLTTIGSSEINGTPGFQAKLVYDFKSGGFSGRLWASGITQKHDGVGGSPSYTGNAVDFGAKLGYAGFGLVGYYYTGSGVGTTGLFILSTAANGRKRDSNGFYGQATYTIGKFTLGGSYGESRLKLASGEVNPTLLERNSSWVGQARYGLTPWVTLIGEYVHTKAEAQAINEATSNALAAGAILFF